MVFIFPVIKIRALWKEGHSQQEKLNYIAGTELDLCWPEESPLGVLVMISGCVFKHIFQWVMHILVAGNEAPVEGKKRSPVNSCLLLKRNVFSVSFLIVSFWMKFLDRSLCSKGTLFSVLMLNLELGTGSALPSWLKSTRLSLPPDLLTNVKLTVLFHKTIKF